MTTPIRFRPDQIEDFSRAALHDGLIFGGDTGTGKTWAAYIWPLLKVGLERITHPCGRRGFQPLRPVLLVAPGDLHDQIMEEGWEKFGIRTTRIDCQDTFLRLVNRRFDADGRALLDPGFYLTSYFELGANKVDPMPDPEKWETRALLQHLCLEETALGGALFARRREVWRDAYHRLEVDAEGTLDDLENATREARALADRIQDDRTRQREHDAIAKCHSVLVNLFTAERNPRYATLQDGQKLFVLRHALAGELARYGQHNGDLGEYLLERTPSPSPLSGEGVGVAGSSGSSVPRSEVFFRTVDDPGPDEPSIAFKCTHSPTLSDLCRESFACVVVDEGVRLKAGHETLIGSGVLSMVPDYRLVLTATPIKNRLPNIFWIVWWVTGGRLLAHERWPYASNPAELDVFSRTYLLSEHNVTKAEAQGRRSNDKRYRKQLPTVCNIHRLWKILGPVLIRRRKEDLPGMVKKIRKVYRVPQGRCQREVLRYHLEAAYVDRSGMPAPGARLQALREAAVDPTSEHLVARPNAQVVPERERGNTDYLPRNTRFYTPKIATVLSLIRDIVAGGDQVLVASAFVGPLGNLSRLLREAGMPHHILDGSMSPARRGRIAKTFKAGQHGPDAFPVALAGAESMAEGHNFFRCPHVILFSYSWALDKLLQLPNRIHRWNSPKDVTVHAVLCNGTMDGKLESLLEEKKDAAELVLDGKLMAGEVDEVNLRDLLDVAAREFDTETKTVCEDKLLKEWPVLREQLRVAAAEWLLGVDDPMPDAGCPTPERKTFTLAELLPVAEDRESGIRNQGPGIRDPAAAPSGLIAVDFGAAVVPMVSAPLTLPPWRRRSLAP